MAEETRLNDLRAVNYILNQRISAEWIYASEEWKKEARLFCVKGLAQIDMLTEIQGKLGEAIAKGYGFQKFESEIVPYLISKGWTGGEGEEIDPKAIGRRVRTIWNTNQASANASSLWQSIQETEDKFPYLQYVGSIAGEKREEHKAFYGLVAPADDPIWQRIFPPNGYGCKCSVKQLTKGQAERIIKQQEENGGRIVASDEAINEAVISSFQHSPQALGGLPAHIEQKHGLGVVNKLLEGVLENRKGLEDTEEHAIFTEGAEFVQKNALFFLGEKFKNNPAERLLMLFKREKLRIGGKSNVFLDDSLEELNKAMQKAVSVLPTFWIEECNKKGKIILERTTNELLAGGHTFIDANVKDLLRLEWGTFFYPNGKTLFDKASPQIGDSLIEINQEDKEGLFVNCLHEYIHRVQKAIPNINRHYQNIFSRRIKGQMKLPLRLFPGYENQPITKQTIKDNFFKPYFGRLYANDETGKDLMTCSIEYLFTPQECRAFLDEDFELFAFTLGLFLRGGRK